MTACLYCATGAPVAWEGPVGAGLPREHIDRWCDACHGPLIEHFPDEAAKAHRI